MLGNEDLFPEMFPELEEREVFGSDRPGRPEAAPTIPRPAKLMACAWISGYVLFLLGFAGLLSRWIGAESWWIVPMGLGFGLVAVNGLVPLQAIVMGGIVNFPIRDWHGPKKPRR